MFDHLDVSQHQVKQSIPNLCYPRRMPCAQGGCAFQRGIDVPNPSLVKIPPHKPCGTGTIRVNLLPARIRESGGLDPLSRVNVVPQTVHITRQDLSPLSGARLTGSSNEAPSISELRQAHTRGRFGRAAYQERGYTLLAPFLPSLLLVEKL